MGGKQRMFRRALVGSLALAVAAAGSAFAQCDTRFQIVNHANQPVRAIYVSASATQAWGQDLLGSGTLGVGQYFLVTPPQAGLYDVRVVLMNDANAERQQIDVCEIQRVTVTDNGIQVQ
jgi:hypothetical protein